MTLDGLFTYGIVRSIACPLVRLMACSLDDACSLVRLFAR